jgi:site-specific DNA-methyltransferase (adenine-specific)
MIFFATQPFASELILSNTKNFRYDLIWYKPLGSGFLNAKRMPLRNHESILVFYRKLPTYNPQMGVGKRKKGRDTRIDNGTNYGKFTKTKLTYDDEGKRFPQSVIEFTNGDRTHEQGHPTQKPLESMRYLVATFSNVNDTVFDGYSGSGTTAEACVSLKRNFIGAELDEKYYIDAKQRIENAQLQTSLFE